MSSSRISAPAPAANGHATLKSRPSKASLYLTFDDGPDPEWTPRVLDVLAAAGAHATFFVVGRWARMHPELVRRAAHEGHIIGNHTWSHRHPWTLAAKAARREVLDGMAAIADITGIPPRHFRPPHGRLRRCMVEAAAEHGQSLVLWSLSAHDWGMLGRSERIAARLRRASAGHVILMHDGRMKANRPEQLLRVLPQFLHHVRARWQCDALAANDAVR